MINSGIQLYGLPEDSIINRSVMIHEDEDDLGLTEHPLSSTTGNAGSRIACGKIEKII